MKKPIILLIGIIVLVLIAQKVSAAECDRTFVRFGNTYCVQHTRVDGRTQRVVTVQEKAQKAPEAVTRPVRRSKVRVRPVKVERLTTRQRRRNALEQYNLWQQKKREKLGL